MDPKRIEDLKHDLRYGRDFLNDALRKATDLRNAAPDEDALTLWNARVATLERLTEDLARYIEAIV